MESGGGYWGEKMERLFSVILLSALISALMPDGNAKSGIKMITGLIVVLMIAEVITGVFSNLK